MSTSSLFTSFLTCSQASVIEMWIPFTGAALVHLYHIKQFLPNSVLNNFFIQPAQCLIKPWWFAICRMNIPKVMQAAYRTADLSRIITFSPIAWSCLSQITGRWFWSLWLALLRFLLWEQVGAVNLAAQKQTSRCSPTQTSSPGSAPPSLSLHCSFPCYLLS